MAPSDFPLITLGIPLYNARSLIERTLLSVLNQTYPNIEYLFVDDKGDSMDIVRLVVENHPRGSAVRIIDQGHNQGIAVARNAIVEHAAGTYLFTMDCDDVITPDCIEILCRKMMEHPVDFVAASFVRVDMEGREYPGCHYADTLIEGEGHPVAQYRYGEGGKLFVATWNKLYRTDFLREHHIRCQPGHFNEDPWFTYQVVMQARSCRLLPDCTLRYTCNPQSVSGIAERRGYSEQIARQYVEIQQLKSAYIRPLVREPFYRNLLADIMAMSLYHAYRIGTSRQLPAAFRRDMQRRLLPLSVIFPTGQEGGRRTASYLLLRAFYRLPLSLRYALVRLGVVVRLRDLLHRWFHF